MVNEQKLTTFIQTVLSKNSALDTQILFQSKSKIQYTCFKLTLIVIYYLNNFLKNILYPTFKLSYQGFLVRISGIHIVFILFYVLCPNEVLLLYIDLYPRQISCLSYLRLFWSLRNFRYWNNLAKKISTLWSKINYIINNCMFLVHTNSNNTYFWGER